MIIITKYFTASADTLDSALAAAHNDANAWIAKNQSMFKKIPSHSLSVIVTSNNKFHATLSYCF